MEFALAVECCRWAFSADAGQCAPLGRAVDWARFVATCRRHRVEALAHKCVRALDLPITATAASDLAADAFAVAERNLQAAELSAALRERFDRAGIELLFVKGLTLSMRVYRDPFIKMGHDIDLLVSPTDIAPAAELIGALGFSLSHPARTPLLAWHEVRKESVWVRPGAPPIDLHGRLADNPRLIPGVGMTSPTQEVAIGEEIRLTTLADRPLFAYLCVHGASSAWFRLKWLADLAGLLHGRTPQQLETLYRGALELGAGRSAAQALLLGAELFATPLSESLAAEIATPMTRLLARTALAQMTGPAAAVEPTERRLGTLPIHLSQLALAPGGSYFVSEAVRQFRTALLSD